MWQKHTRTVYTKSNIKNELLIVKSDMTAAVFCLFISFNLLIVSGGVRTPAEGQRDKTKGHRKIHQMKKKKRKFVFSSSSSLNLFFFKKKKTDLKTQKKRKTQKQKDFSKYEQIKKFNVRTENQLMKLQSNILQLKLKIKIRCKMWKNPNQRRLNKKKNQKFSKIFTQISFSFFVPFIFLWNVEHRPLEKTKTELCLNINENLFHGFNIYFHLLLTLSCLLIGWDC